jgi:N-acetylmuramoyl-L-alanine amidase
MRIALDIGHMKSAPGAVNHSQNLSEFQYNEKLVKEIAEKLKAKGNEVDIIYRESYGKLPGQINAVNPDIAISFHCNAYNTKASGTETLFWHKSVKGKAMAEIMQKALVSVLQLPNRGIKPKTEEDRGGTLLRDVKAPIILIEPFFIDNDNDLKKAQDNHDAFVDAIVEAIAQM